MGATRPRSAPPGAPRSSRRRAPTTRTGSMRTPERHDRARTPSRAAPTTISAVAPPSSPNTWAHVATTYDGANLRLYVDGTLVGSQAATGSIATSTGAAEDRRQHDLGRVLRRPDRRGPHLQPRADAGRDPDGHDPEHRHAGHDSHPSAPATLSATGAIGSVTLSWAAATDNVGVVRYNVHRGTTAGFTPTVANRIAQPTGHELRRRRARRGHLLLPGHRRGRRRQRRSGARRRRTRQRRPTRRRRSAPATLTATPGPGQAVLTWSASTDNVGVARYDVHRSTTSGFTPSAANRIAQPTTTSYTDTGLAAGTYYYKVVAADASGNLSARRRRRLPSSPPHHRSASSLPTDSTKAAARASPDSSGSGNTGASPGRRGRSASSAPRSRSTA